jgi:hypothetical protein
MRRLFPVFLLFLIYVTPIHAQNTPESDYQYQLSQYRRNYAEFQIYKKDYLANNTLDNEQKALQSAQNTIVARELTMASFLRILKQSIYAAEVDIPITSETQASLDTLLNYYLDQSKVVTQIQTKKDLLDFSTKTQAQLKSNQAIIDTVQVVNKLVHLIRFNQKINEQYALLKPRLESKKNLALVASGFEEIVKYQTKINDDTTLIIGQITKIKNSETSARSKAVEASNIALNRIQLNERLIVNRLIDFDKNYVDH